MEDLAFILDEKIRIVTKLSQSKNKVHDYSSCWYNIEGIDYMFKNEFFINSFINELIGEELSKMIELKSAEYEIIKLEGIDFITEFYNSYESDDGKVYHLITKDFKEPDKTYFRVDELLENPYYDYQNSVNELEYKCVDKNNFIKIKKNLFKLLILSFFIGQVDANYPGNLLFQKNNKTNSELSLAPIFDHADSFYFSDTTEEMEEIITYFGVLKFPSDELKEELFEFKENIDTMKTFINLNFNEFFRNFQTIKPIKFSNKLYNSYVNFCEEKQNILYRCLK